MNLQKRIDLLIRLGHYISSGDESLQSAIQKAFSANNWFTPGFIEVALGSIAEKYVNADVLMSFAGKYNIPETNNDPKTVGLVMAGNIPLVGFHDLLCIFLTGHNALIKVSSKDEILITHIISKLSEWHPETANHIAVSTLLKGCDAYIATGSNNSARYFDYYFGKYPNIIRRNKTSVAMLTGDESNADLEQLGDDVHLFFGLGCRNVTKLYVPPDYDFVPLLEAFRKYNYFADHHKYKNNYDYQLAVHLLNQKYHMTNGSILLSENTSLFSPISQLNYEFFSGESVDFQQTPEIQCVVGKRYVPFGQAQSPSITDFADGADTMKFLLEL